MPFSGTTLAKQAGIKPRRGSSDVAVGFQAGESKPQPFRDDSWRAKVALVTASVCHEHFAPYPHKSCLIDSLNASGNHCLHCKRLTSSGRLPGETNRLILFKYHAVTQAAPGTNRKV